MPYLSAIDKLHDFHITEDTPYWEMISHGKVKAVCMFFLAMNDKKTYNIAYEILLSSSKSILTHKNTSAELLELHAVHNLCDVMMSQEIFIYSPEILLELARKYPLSDAIICDFWENLPDTPLVYFDEILELYRFRVFEISLEMPSEWITPDHVQAFFSRGICLSIIRTQSSGELHTGDVINFPGRDSVIYASPAICLIIQDVEYLTFTDLDKYILSHEWRPEIIRLIPVSRIMDSFQKWGITGTTMARYRYEYGVLKDVDLDELLSLRVDKIIYLNTCESYFCKILPDLPRITQAGFKLIFNYCNTHDHRNILIPIFTEYTQVFKYPKSAR